MAHCPHDVEFRCSTLLVYSLSSAPHVHPLALGLPLRVKAGGDKVSWGLSGSVSNLTLTEIIENEARIPGIYARLPGLSRRSISYTGE
jgi:hypothetical protein